MHSYTEEIQRGVTAVLDNIKVHIWLNYEIGVPLIGPILNTC